MIERVGVDANEGHLTLRLMTLLEPLRCGLTYVCTYVCWPKDEQS